MKLSDFFKEEHIVTDGTFTQLDEVDTSEKGSLVYCLDLKFLKKAIAGEYVSCIITTPELAHDTPEKGVVISPNPRLDFLKLYIRLTEEGLNAPVMECGIGSNCTIHPSAVVSKKTRIGDNVVIGANSVVEDQTIIGDNTYIGSCVTVGAEGLVNVDDGESKLFIKHAGGVEIGKNVAILSNSAIAKSLFRSFTTIGDHSRIGILSNIGHGAKLGKNCVISGNCVVAGRTVLGDNVWMGASSSIAQGLRIGRNAQIKMGSVVIRDVQDNEVVSGNFAMLHTRNMKQYLRASHE